MQMLTFPWAVTTRLTGILVYRFLFDLQGASQRSLKLASDDPLHISASSNGDLSFVMGSIGSVILSQEAQAVDEHRDVELIPAQAHV